MSHDIATHESRFFAYAEPFSPPDCLPLQIKLTHTREVLANARAIVEFGEGLLCKLNLDHMSNSARINTEMTRIEMTCADVTRAALLAALYHDVGRFEQFTRFGTFRDADSINHGALASQLIRRHGFLDDETAQVRRLARIGVCLHNRYRLPALGAHEALVTAVVRDADKLDIFRVLAQHLNAAVPSGDVVLHVRNEPLKWSPAVAEMVLAGQVPNYSDLHYINDFRMLLVSWLRDLGFAFTRKRLAESGHVEPVLSGLPECEALLPVRTCLWALLENARVGKPL